MIFCQLLYIGPVQVWKSGLDVTTFFQCGLEVLYDFERLHELNPQHVLGGQIKLVYTSALYVAYRCQFCCFEVSNANGLKF